MRVCLDVQSALGPLTGVGRYTHALAAHLPAAAPPGAEVRAFCFDFHGRGGDTFPPELPLRRVRWMPGRLAQQAWKRLGAPPFDWFAGAADVYHFPNFIRPPLSRGRSVVTIHDVSFLRMPETTEAANLRYLRRHIRRTVERADLVLTDCAAMADDIRELLDVPATKLRPVWLGIEPRFAPPGDAAVAAMRGRLGIERPYLLFVGTLEPRKNIPFLVDIFERLADLGLDLRIVGRTGWHDEPILRRLRTSPLAARIHHHASVEDADLPALYAGAACFVFPSRYEGFGFPPLEAMACGAPVVSSPFGSLREVLAEGAELLEAFDLEAWADAVRRVVTDGGVRAQRIALGHARAARFTWPETARRTWAVYRELA